MEKKLLKIVVFLYSLFFIYVGVSCIFDSKYINGLLVITFSFLFNPLVIDMLLKSRERIARVYYDVLKTIIPYITIIMIMPLALFLYNLSGLNQEEFILQEYKAILAICVYTAYFFILFLYDNEAKTKKYRIFGTFYLVCVIFSLLTENMDSFLIEIYNFVCEGQLDKESYSLLIDGCLNPIKEAILTYIIFDTAIDAKNNVCSSSMNKVINNGLVRDDKTLVKEDNNSEFEVKVLEVDIGTSKKYKIKIYKK